MFDGIGIPNTGTRYLQRDRPGLVTTRITNEMKDAIMACGQVPTGTPYQGVSALVAVRVRVEGNLTGGGKYWGWFRSMPKGAIDITTDLSDHDLGTNTRKCFIMNAAERLLDTHDLTETVAGPVQTRDFTGHLLPQLTNGVPWVEITNYDIHDCATV